MKLGHLLGVLGHVCEYWRFRAGTPHAPRHVAVDELELLLEEFCGDLDLSDQMMFA